MWMKSCKKPKEDFKLSIFDSIELVNQEGWRSIIPADHLFLGLPFLKAIENSLSEEMEFRYLMFYNDQRQLVGIAAIQVVDFTETAKKQQRVVNSLTLQLQQKLLETAEIKMLICGNLFATGQTGFYFNPEMSEIEATTMLANGLSRLRRQEEQNDNVISFMLIKELWEANNGLLEYDFRSFEIDKNMVLELHSNWTTFDDFLGDMTAKFRTKAKAAFKRSAEITAKPLDAEEIKKHATTIAEFYEEVVSSASFSFGELKADSFVELKERMGNNYQLVGYFLEGNLIGFSSAFIDKTSLDAHYVGFNQEQNRTYALYQRMLYDMVVNAIDKKMTKVVFGRTAEQLKSTLGAVAQPMYLYIRHRNHLSNKLLKHLIGQVKPTEFESRYPFKADFKP